MSSEGSPAPADTAEPAAPAEADGQWFVLHTRSRQEKALAADLQAMGVHHYLPLVGTVRYYGRRKARVSLPLFPGYLFLWGTREQAYDADRTKRVARLIPVPDQARFEHELQHIRTALDQGARLDPQPTLAKGTRVEVRSGPFKGLQGIVENRLSANRLLLDVTALGQSASLEIDGALLEPIEPAPLARV